MSRVAIIGAGLAGMTCAARLKDEGYTGEIHIFNGEQDAPYEKPNLSKGRVGLVSPVALLVDDVRMVEAVTSVSTKFRTIGTLNRVVGPFDHIVFATGRQPASLPNLSDALPCRTREDVRKIRAKLSPDAHVVIVGAGLIGMELAASINSEVAALTVIEAGPRALARVVPEVIANAAVLALRNQGVGLLFETQVEASRDGVLHLRNEEMLRADVVIVAIGARPDTVLAEKAGLEIGPHGISVAPDMTTNKNGILAIGDVAAVTLGDEICACQNYTAARSQGEVAALTILGQTAKWAPETWFWSDQGETRIEGVGHANGEQAVTEHPDGGISVCVMAQGRQVGQFALGSRKAMRTVRAARAQVDANQIELEAI